MYQIDGKDQIGKVSKFQVDQMRGKQMTDRTRKKQQPKSQGLSPYQPPTFLCGLK